MLCMSVHPGYSGQKFIPEAIERVRALRELLPASVRIQVDGGVGLENIAELRAAGATLFVAGASIFGHEIEPRPTAASWSRRRLGHEPRSGHWSSRSGDAARSTGTTRSSAR